MAVGLGLVCLWLAGAAPAQDDLEDVFRDLGTATVDKEALPADRKPGDGTIRGQVIDGETGIPVEGVTVILVWPEPGGGTEPHQEVAVTDVEGAYEFASVPPGTYTINFVKSGYRSASMTNFEVLGDQLNLADFPLPPLPAESSEEVLELEAFVVEASVVGEIMDSLELRLDSDALLNVMSAEDLSRFAASDVAEALKRVAGVNIVEGKFAIIRGLEDRYSSTLFNGAPVPSPDPDRQSAQLDLFPSEVVDNLVIVKSFSPELPGNSAGGSIDIVTQEYPETWTFELKAKSRLNENPWDEFLHLRSGANPIPKFIDGSDTLGEEYGGALGGRYDLFGHEVRLRGVVNWSTDYETGEGFKQVLEPRNRFANSQGVAGVPDVPGDLGFGALTLTQGHFDRTVSTYEDQLSWYGGLGVDLDEAGQHKLDFVFFRTDKKGETVRLDDNAYLPGFDYLAPGGPVDLYLNTGELAEAGSFLGVNAPGPLSPRFVPGNGNAANGAWFVQMTRDQTLQPSFGAGTALWFSSFGETTTFDTRRTLTLYQLNGDHHIDLLDGLQLHWAGNYAKTSQDQTSRKMRYWYEPCGWTQPAVLFGCSPGTQQIPIPTAFPTTPESLGEGTYFSTRKGLIETGTNIDEKQWFGRIDADYERQLRPWLTMAGNAGVWYEHVERDVAANFFDGDANGAVNPACNPRNARPPDFRCLIRQGAPTPFSSSLVELGQNTFNLAFLRQENGLFKNTRESENQTDRDILAFALASKSTLFEDFDVLAGMRIEHIKIESNNDPFTDEPPFFDGSPQIFPSKYLFFDRFDNPVRESSPLTPPWNDEVIGLPVQLGPCRGDNVDGGPPPPGPAPGLEGLQCVDLATREEIQAVVNGKIDETKILPAAGLTWRALPGLTLRAAYSQTVARPSSRELGYYATFEPGSDDAVVGNPQLQLSDVDSYDLRAEYVFGESGDLFALSGFYKTIDNPIESIVLRDFVVRSVAEPRVAQFRTFFNNPNTAELLGVEVEARKTLDFIPHAEFLRYFSLGGNFTYIDAKIERTEAELVRSDDFFDGVQTVNDNRRLVGQPEWIANADVSFNQPDWGTKITLAYYAISDVLDALGQSERVLASGIPRFENFTLDQYVDSYDQLDLVASQKIGFGLTLKGTIKNLTDSKRRIVYDPEATSSNFVEEELRFGRQYSIELKFEYPFGVE